MLAACDTATAETGDTADEFNGLPAELLDAGFAGVVGASWPVDDTATDRLMPHFWEAYAENGRKAPAALRLAQLAMRAGPALPTQRGAARAIGPAASAPGGMADTARVPPSRAPGRSCGSSSTRLRAGSPSPMASTSCWAPLALGALSATGPAEAVVQALNGRLKLLEHEAFEADKRLRRLYRLPETRPQRLT